MFTEGNGAFYVDADGDWPCSLLDKAIVVPITHALDNSEKSLDVVQGVCALTGKTCRLVNGKFPPADLPIGPTILFSRYDQRLANGRYGRFGSQSMPVGDTLVRRLAAAAKVLTTRERRGRTWQFIPGERPKQTDLLIGFVEAAPDAPVAASVIEDDYTEETPQSAADSTSSVAAFEKRTERLIEAIHAKVGADFRHTPVRLAVLRKVDTTNRKVVYAGAPTVDDLYRAATGWATGEHNVPRWLTLPVLRSGERNPQLMCPPHVAPLAMIGLSKQIFLRSGKRPQGKKKEQVGMAAAEAVGLFLESDHRRVGRVLRLILARRSTLLSHVGHLQHAPECCMRRKKAKMSIDCREALRTITVLAVLLHKLGRTKESYMNDAAFKLGQLLAAADMVHAGYCADVRGGEVPPSLLGNQVFCMAQTVPVKALSMLCRRWKPYDGWAHKAARERSRADTMITSKKKDEQQRGWDIKKALRHAREMRLLAAELAATLPGVLRTIRFVPNFSWAI